MHLYVGSDHYGLELVQKIQTYVQEHTDYSVEYIGSKDIHDTLNLPDFIKPVCDKVLEERTLGILICGTGAGVAIGANKVRGIRATLCRKEIDAKWAREKDDANILCLSGWDTTDEELSGILKNWFGSTFHNHKILPSMKIMDDWR